MEKLIEKAKKVKAKHQDEWLENNSIVSIGVGFIEENVIGILIGVKGNIEPIIAKIPDTIDGIPISIKKVSKIRAL